MTERAPETRLEARSISIGYSGRDIIRNLSFSVPTGRFTALLGPNGSGKSTLLRALAGLITPASGAVVIDGLPMASMSRGQIARRLSLMPQSPRAPEDITVRDLVMQGRYPHRGLLARWSLADDAACRRALELTETLGLADTPLCHLSGGQRQRAWIAMTLAQSSDILLLDEPTTYLDISHQLSVMALLRRLVHDQGTTVVAVLHDVTQAARFADQMLLLKDGQLVASGPPVQVMRADLIAAVFAVEATIIEDPVDHTPVCLARR